MNVALLRRPGSAGTLASPSGPKVSQEPAVAPAWSPAGERRVGDRAVLACLLACFAALAAVTWRRWGVPEIDAGAELTTADLVKHGAVVYRDVRYYYGPLGLYSLVLAFKLLGTSFTTAYVFGLAQAAAILASFYVLARHWLAPLVAGLGTAVLMAIGFSGTAFNFVLPHTNSGTFGILFLLLALLALTRERLLLAGVAAGLVALTRPEFLAVTFAALAGYVLVQWRVEGRHAALASAWRLALPALAIPAVVLGWFAARVGLHDLIAENLWPVRFVRVGAKTEGSWMPFTAASAAGVLMRAAIYVGLLAALVACAERWRARRGAARALAAWPLPAALAVLALADGALRAIGVLGGERAAIEQELRHLMIGMSWLPALGFAAAALALWRLARRERSPLGGSWPVDAALIVAAAGLGLRAYNAFTTYDSYAPYYAAPLVLLLAILHARTAERRPGARVAVLGALGIVAAGLAAYALGGLYRHDDTAVHTPRGTFMTEAAAAVALQAAVRSIDAQTRPAQRILAAPLDGGLYFMADRRPALRELSLLPGLIDSAAEQRQAIARLRVAHVALVAVGARDFSSWGTPRFGVDYDPLLGAYLRTSASSRETLGTPAQPVAGTNPSHGFTILRLPG
jgi:hypothetical protein